MKQTENYGFEKPDIKEFFKLETWKNNMDKIDEAIKERETAQGVTDEEIKKIKNVQFTQADERKNIESKETLPVLFGKIARWIADLKTVAFSGSYNDLSNKPTIPTVVNNNTTTEAGYALDARQANPNVDGSLAKQISTLNSGLTNKYFLKVLAKDWSGFVGTLFPQFNVQNDNVVDIYADKTDGTYPAVRVARASADYDGNNIPDTYLKKSDAKTMFNTGYRQVSSNEFNKYFSNTWSYAGADGLSIDSGTWLVNYSFYVFSQAYQTIRIKVCVLYI